MPIFSQLCIRKNGTLDKSDGVKETKQEANNFMEKEMEQSVNTKKIVPEIEMSDNGYQLF